MTPENSAPSWPALAAAFGVYVVLGLTFKSVFLNWIVGPLWLLLTLFILPLGIAHMRNLATRLRPRREP